MNLSPKQRTSGPSKGAAAATSSSTSTIPPKSLLSPNPSSSDWARRSKSVLCLLPRSCQRKRCSRRRRNTGVEHHATQAAKLAARLFVTLKELGLPTAPCDDIAPAVIHEVWACLLRRPPEEDRGPRKAGFDRTRLPNVTATRYKR